MKNADTPGMRRKGYLLASLGLLILTYGAIKTWALLARGYGGPGILIQHLFIGFFALAFGAGGWQLLREARALDYEAARRPPPRKLPLRRVA